MVIKYVYFIPSIIQMEVDDPIGSDELNLSARQMRSVTGKMALVFSCDGEC